MSLINTNKCEVVGVLVEVRKCDDVLYGPNKDKEAVSTEIVIKSVVDGQEFLNTFQSFQSKLTKDGKENGLYTAHKGIASLLNKKVLLPNASIEPNRYYNTNTNQLVETVRYKYASIMTTALEDKATFKFAGVVSSNLIEFNDKEGNLKHYRLKMAQANYNQNDLLVATFAVEPTQTAIVNAINTSYPAGTTVELSGILSNITTIERETVEAAFGEPTISERISSERKLIITGGSTPFVDDRAYTAERLAPLKAAYEKGAQDITAAAQAKQDTSKTEGNGTPASNTDLAGFVI